VFFGSFLLFLIQPLVGRTLLPVFGGCASVWMICLASYQTLLLAGYFYAHAFQRPRLAGIRTHYLHIALLGVAALWTGGLVFARPFLQAWFGHIESPTLGVLFCVLLVAGLPYVLLAAGSTLVQTWVARQTRDGKNVYSLYAVSNAGSLLGLLAYPTLLEPFVPLTVQWLGFAVAVATYTVLMWMTANRCASHPQFCQCFLPTQCSQPALRRFLPSWFLLPAASAFLLNATTESLMVDVTPMPFVWVLPLAAFLLSYVLGFSKVTRRRRWLWCGAGLLALVGAAFARGMWGTGSFLPNAGAGVAVLVLVGTVLHRWLYETRPPLASLTRYYLAIAAGGAGGGLLASLVAPLVFNRVLEYPLILCVCAALLVWRLEGKMQHQHLTFRLTVMLACGVGYFVLLQVTARHSTAEMLFRCRNFYGCLAVTQKYEDLGADGRLPVNYLWCGQTTHGFQVLSPAHQRVPTAYYGPTGGGIAFNTHEGYQQGQPVNVGVVGLGAGMLAVYGRPGDLFRFFEIDPQVVQIATDTRLFSFLPDARCAIDLIDGDARRMLEIERAENNPFYDLLVIDAYSGDAVPYHLVTREAFRLYLDRLAPDGMLAVHVSNWHIDLLPVCKAVADELGICAHGTISYSDSVLTAGSIWVFFTRQPISYVYPRQPERIRPVDWSKVRTIRMLTDDRGSLLPLLR